MGDTDSEHAFCLLLERIAPLWQSGLEIPPLADRRRVVESFARLLRSFGPANFIYVDGDALFVHGHERTQPGRNGTHPPGIHVLCRTCQAEPTDSLPGVDFSRDTEPQQVFLAASVPLTQEEWRPLEAGELAVARQGKLVP